MIHSFRPDSEWQIVNKSSTKNPQSVPVLVKNKSITDKCYFLITINGAPSGKIIFQLERKKAPMMSSKFLELCSNSGGNPAGSYQGSRILKTKKEEAVLIGPRLPPNSNSNEFFTADATDIKEKTGSVRFLVQNSSRGVAEVSTNIQIVLIDRPQFHNCSTVFAHVNQIEKITLFEYLIDFFDFPGD